MQRYIYILLVFVLINSTSCNKDSVPYVALAPGFKEFILFEEGTWWVYMHTVDSVTDSMVVVSKIVEITDWEDRETGKIYWRTQDFLYKVYSHRNGRTFEYSGRGACPPMSDAELNEHPRPCFRARRIIGNSNTLIFAYKPKIGYENKPMEQSTITVAEKYDILEIGGEYYEDVIRIHETKNPTEGTKETNFYIARNYGIIRYDINNKFSVNDKDNWQRWDLVRSHIIQ